MAYFRKKQKSLSLRLRILLILIISAVGIISLDATVRPILISAAKIRGINAVQASVYSAIREEMAKGDCSSIVKISRNDSGSLTSVETDTMALSGITSALATSAIESLKELDDSYISVPSGLLSGISFLSATGFPLKFKIRTGNHLRANVSSDFKSAGINQTLHTIKFNISAEVTVFIPGSTVRENVPIDIILAQTVIVGEVPESFSDITLLSDLYEKN
ncbi:MAG: sporulation protein YunB [Oscillospiraceae bacterium]|nr:sporulation protein YunB [Oscillospiraceae bacterium]